MKIILALLKKDSESMKNEQKEIARKIKGLKK